MAHNGNFMVSGVTDEEFAQILQIKMKHPKAITFQNSNQLQPSIQGGPQPIQTYALTIPWQDQEGMQAITEILALLLKKANS